MNGWTCPGCGRGYSPAVLQCWTCGLGESNTVTTTRANDTGQSPLFCSHANEVPSFRGPGCSCSARCYCRTNGSCRERAVSR